MPQEQPRQSQFHPDALAGGASLGSLLVLVAQNFLDDPWQMRWTYAAPAIAAAVSSVWIWAKPFLATAAREVVVHLHFRRARKTIERKLEDTKLSPKEEKHYQKELEKLDRHHVKALTAKYVAATQKARTAPPDMPPAED